MPEVKRNLPLYWSTARHLKTIQVWRHAWRPHPRVRAIDATRRNLSSRFVAPILKNDPWLGGRRWRHLNQEREVKTWNDTGIDKLWLYHLHYIEHPSFEIALQWIRENPPGEGVGWEPYPLSRRISNWIIWLLGINDDSDSRRRVEESLLVQAEWLRQTIEWRLLGNHIFANAKALILAGLYFQGTAAERWLNEGLEILRSELPEQILNDGAHFELSPMYHALVLEDLLDLINVSTAFERNVESHRANWRATASQMLGWLEQMTHPNGRLAYFNDSVAGDAPSLQSLVEYADRLNVVPWHQPVAESGYIRLQSGQTVAIFDAGPVGPTYQPGHGHCDLLSLEVTHRGKPVITNTGISTYESCALRLEERRTAAHNTLRVDGQEQSEMWASFRVGRRANVIRRETDGAHWAEGAHDGYRRHYGNVTHNRRVELETHSITVRDRLHGTGFHRAEIFWHLMPDANVSIAFSDGIESTRRESWWCAGFNLRVKRPLIVGKWAGQLPAELVTLIHFS